MPAITATFINGHVDKYNGKRAVKAAWMITRNSDGKVLASGHSLHRKNAQATAEGTFRQVASSVLDRHPAGVSERPRSGYPQLTKYFTDLSKKKGFSTWKEAYEAYRADMVHIRQAATIVVIDL